MKILFSKLVLVALLIVFASSNIYAEEKVEVVTNSNTTVDIQISGLAGTYQFSYPENTKVYHSGSGITTVTLSGMVGILDAGIPVHVLVERSNSSATKINVYSPNYKSLDDLESDGTIVLDFTVPYTGSNDVMMSLQ